MNKNDISVLFKSIRERTNLKHLVLLDWNDRSDVDWIGQYHVRTKTIALNYYHLRKYNISGIREIIIHEFAHASIETLDVYCGHNDIFKEKVKELGGILTEASVKENIHRELFLLDK